ncbi:hypothetical protein Hanom_Chr06g00554781 [Helianthus anomalus]
MVKFHIPNDPFTEVITNLCLDFDLGLICPFNLVNLARLGLELESPSWLWLKSQDKHTCMCGFCLFILF